MKTKLLALLVGVLLAASSTFAQQTNYALGSTSHGPFQQGVAIQTGQFLGSYFELPQVTAGAAGYIQWSPGKIYPDGAAAGGYNINPSASTSGFALDASKSNCAPPAFSSCDIAVATPYGGITGTITGTFTAGEQVSQATSNAIAYALNGATGTGALYFSLVVSGTANGTNTWTGASSGATLASPSGAPSVPGTVIVTATPGIAKLPGISPVAYLVTNSSSVPTSITYPYQLSAGNITASALFVGFCSGTVGSATTNYAFPLGGVAVACSSNTAATVGAPVSSPGVLRNLYVKDGTAPGGTLTGVWTVLVNGTATPITCTITGAATTCNDTTHYAVVNAGDLVTIKDVTGTLSAEAAPTVSVEKY